MLSKITINAILIGLITTLSMVIQHLTNYSQWFVPLIVAILTGCIVAIKEYLTNGGISTIKAEVKKKKEIGKGKYYLSLIGII